MEQTNSEITKYNDISIISQLEKANVVDIYIQEGELIIKNRDNKNSMSIPKDYAHILLNELESLIKFSY